VFSGVGVDCKYDGGTSYNFNNILDEYGYVADWESCSILGIYKKK
jgi:hypothetical protein